MNLGPILFTLYIASIAKVISSFGVRHHQYADDSQLYIAANRDSIQMKLDLLRDCTAAVNDWFHLNGLSLNPDKSEVFLLKFGVPQGSMLGPILFTLYVAPVANVISSFSVRHHQYTDDSHLCIAANRDNIWMELDLLRDCTAAVNDWFLLNGLSLNPDKSKVLLLGTAAKPRTIGAVGPVSVVSASINTTDSIKNLGVFLDFSLGSPSTSMSAKCVSDLISI